MAIFKYRKNNYLHEQEQKNTELSLVYIFCFLAATGTAAYFVITILRSDIRINIKIILFLLLTIPYFILCIFLLYRSSKYHLFALKYFLGNKGEMRVLTELLKLSDNYTIYFNGELDYGNLDIGILKDNIFFNIEVKNHKGQIDFDGHNLLRNGESFFEGDPIDEVLRNKDQLNYKFQKSKTLALKIISIVVFSNPSCWVNTPLICRNVYICHNRGVLRLVESFKF